MIFDLGGKVQFLELYHFSCVNCLAPEFLGMRQNDRVDLHTKDKGALSPGQTHCFLVTGETVSRVAGALVALFHNALVRAVDIYWLM